MDQRILGIVGNLELNPGATGDLVQQVQLRLGIMLPQEYVDFMMYSNGAEGPIGKYAYLALWTLEELVELNKAYQVDEFAPGLLLFGSDGGDVAFAFDKRSGALSIVQVPFIGMKLTEAKPRGRTFSEFLFSLYNERA